MGRWADRKKKNTIKDEIYTRLSEMFKEGKGRSRHEDKKAGMDRKYIYTEKTYNNYKYISKNFATWIFKTHPECKHLKECKKYGNEYLQSLIDGNKSPYTISTYKAAIVKLFKVNFDYFMATPSRTRKDIKRSRYEVEYDKHISEQNEKRWGKITEAIGLRLSELTRIRGTDLVQDIRTGKYYVYVTRGTKGGKVRKAEVIDNDIVEILKITGDKPAFSNPPSAFDNHHHRAIYAQKLYKMYARYESQIPAEDRYIMRKDRKGVVLDKKAMKIVSESLGHSRISVIASSYLY